MWEFTGVFRIHFNRKDEFPRLASITAPDHSWEMLVAHVKVSGVKLYSGWNKEAITGLEPYWWLGGTGRIKVDGDTAYVTPI